MHPDLAAAVTCDWELLQVRARHVVRTGDGPGQLSERSEEYATRIGVGVNGRYGVAVLGHGRAAPDLDRLVEEALRNAGPAAAPARAQHDEPGGGPLPALPARADLRWPGWLAGGEVERRDLRYTVRDMSGRAVTGRWSEAWRVLRVDGRPVARVPAGAVPLDAPAPGPDADHLLLPPYVLAQLLLPVLSSALLGRRGLRRWPRTALSDPAWDAGTDLEARPRTPRCLASAGRLHVRPSGRTGGEPGTGHGGVAGPVLRDLLVGAGRDAGPDLPAGVPVLSGSCLSVDDDGRNALLGLVPRREHGPGPEGCPEGEVLLLPLLDVADLLDAGQWCGPWQRGAGAWTSRWLRIGAARRWR